MGLSREDELAADAFGVRTAGRAGYDPNGLRRFVEAISRTPSEKRSLLSKTHPDAADRIEAMDEEIAGIHAAERGTVTAAARFEARSEGAAGPGR
jgi:predicted Zn-dependent protease